MQYNHIFDTNVCFNKLYNRILNSCVDIAEKKYIIKGRSMMITYYGKEVFRMAKAANLGQMLNSFSLFALDEENFDDYYVDVNQARGVDVSRKVVYRFNSSYGSDIPKKLLLLGHYGCGKTTELYKMSQLLSEKYLIVKYSIAEETDIVNFDYVDFIFTILNNIFKIAKSNKLEVSDTVIEKLFTYWHNEEIIEVCNHTKLELDSNIETKVSWLSVLSAKIKGVFQTGSETKSTIRTKIEPSLKILISEINDLIKSINDAIAPKKLLLIVEDLDKLEIPQSEDLFLKHRKTITSIRINCIYTFPIYLYYSQYYNEILSDFDADELLSIIKVKNRDGTDYNVGIDILKQIVWKRCDPKLFTDEALDFLVRKSGGSFRDLFTMISNAALQTAISTDKEIIEIEQARISFNALKSRKERALKNSHIEILQDVYNDKTKKPIGDDDGNLMELLHSMNLIEYNGERWCDLHPAIEEYLIEKEYINVI